MPMLVAVAFRAHALPRVYAHALPCPRVELPYTLNYHTPCISEVNDTSTRTITPTHTRNCMITVIL